eukprot:1030417-Rhodomonas_salina.1
MWTYDFAANASDCYCRPGFYENTTNMCTECPADHYCLGDAPPQHCPLHSLTPPGSNHSGACTCDRGYYESGQDNCTLCPANSWCWGGVKNDCPADRVSEPGLSWPDNCTCHAGNFLHLVPGATTLERAVLSLQ